MNKLRETLMYVEQHSLFYQELFKTHKVNISEIANVGDLQKIPFTSKGDLSKRNKDFICVESDRLIDYVTTSGTTGSPVTIALTDADLERLALNEARSFETAGITHKDLIQLLTTMDRRFMAGMAYFLGARKLGAGIIRVGNGLPEMQWQTILDLKPTVLVTVPSFLCKLIDFAEENKIDYKETSVRKAICIGEAIRNADFTLNALGKKIRDSWPIELHSTYASSEMAAAFTECSSFKGGHQQEDLIIVEIIGEDNKPVKNGQPGELVITTLGIKGMPLIRFRTGDITALHNEPCPCGRTSPRLGPIIGRKQQMIKYKGTSFYPSAIFDTVERFKEIKNYQVELRSSPSGNDDILLHIGTAVDRTQLSERLAESLRARLRVVPQLNFLAPEQVNSLLYPDNSRKAVKFVDKRTRT
jgi:phenylacetate-CoA ligase